MKYKYENRIKIILQYLSQSVVRIKSSSKWQGCISELRINKILKHQTAISSEMQGQELEFYLHCTQLLLFLEPKRKESWEPTIGGRRWKLEN